MCLKNLTIAMLMAACSSALAGELSDIYFQKVHANLEEWAKARMQSQQAASVKSTNHGVTEFGIERTACFGDCPVYTFIIKSDGSFRYKGEKFTQRQGEFTGTVPVGEFDRLAQFIKDIGFMQLSDTYDRADTDSSTVFTMVVMSGQRKVVSDYAQAGPSKLWAIERLIDDLLTKAHWNEPPKTEDKKK
jgi:hypothetical protein